MSVGFKKDVGSRKNGLDENFSVAMGIIPKKALLVCDSEKTGPPKPLSP